MDSTHSSIASDSGMPEENKKQTGLESRFECPICLNCLRNPYLTSCGHRFCQECILEWLRKKKNRHCPVDGRPIEEKDLFPDNYTKREITQQTVRCTFPDCDQLTPLLDLEAHVAKCHETAPHENGSDVLAKEAEAWEAPAKSHNSHQNQLIMSLFERVVRLEQKSREQELQLADARSTITRMILDKEQFMANLPLRICNGCYVWNIKSIKDHLKVMSKNPSDMLYSDGFYTSYLGYKFCARLNVSPNNSSYISLLVHLMKGENDYILSWPFKGRISFTLIHPFNSENSISEVMCTKPGLKAFEKPSTPISPRAFGYTEFTLVDDIINQGFLSENGSINIKIEITCV